MWAWVSATAGTAVTQFGNGQYFVFPQPILDFTHTVAAYIHSKYLFHNICGFGVRQQMIAVVGVGYVAIRHFAVYSLAFLCLCLFYGSYLFRSITGVKLVKPISQRGKLVILSCSIYTVVNGNIAYLIFGKYYLYQFACFQIVSA